MSALLQGDFWAPLVRSRDFRLSDRDPSGRCIFIFSLYPPRPHTDMPTYASALSEIILTDGSESKTTLWNYFVNHDQINRCINLYYCSFFECLCLSNLSGKPHSGTMSKSMFHRTFFFPPFIVGHKLRLQRHQKKTFHQFLDEVERNLSHMNKINHIIHALSEKT